jgi:Zn-finger protein
LKQGLIAFLALLFITPSLSAAAEPAGTLLGDKSDGSRAQPNHLIELYPEDIDPASFDLVKGDKIKPDIDESSKVLLPFSTKWTCGECHSYNIINKGWHYNAADPNVPPGRFGQPWIYFDARLATQILLSYRPWPGTFRPEQVGLTDSEFIKIFGRHTPGGGVGERDANGTEQKMRQFISGKLEVNCLACHDADPAQDQGGTNGYAIQVARGNFRWAAAASSGFAQVTGSADDMPDTYDPFDPFEVQSAKEGQKSPPVVTYHKAAFDNENRVFFNIVREIPAKRCYYCHSNLYLSDTEKIEKWTTDEDVHLKAGLTCVDCHRNGLDHNIIRGYAGESLVSSNPLVAVSSCESCHLSEDGNKPKDGRLGAPVPKHPGIPPIHFEKLTCTACHSGPWPARNTRLTKTSRAHRLGTPNVNKSDEVLPHILSTVFAKQHNDPKIAPHKLLWPAFWAELAGQQVKPVNFDIVKQTVGEVFADIELPQTGDWPTLSEENIAEALVSLAKAVKGKAVYIAGGNLYSLDDSGILQKQQGHPAAQPYLWPLAHDVRPAAQSLGVRSCADCHATDSPFFFGTVNVDSPVVADRISVRKMVEFEGLNSFYTWIFAFSFVFRPWLKIVAIGSCVILAGILLLYSLKALACVAKLFSNEER